MEAQPPAFASSSAFSSLESQSLPKWHRYHPVEVEGDRYQSWALLEHQWRVIGTRAGHCWNIIKTPRIFAGGICLRDFHTYTIFDRRNRTRLW